MFFKVSIQKVAAIVISIVTLLALITIINIDSEKLDRSRSQTSSEFPSAFVSTPQNVSRTKTEAGLAKEDLAPTSLQLPLVSTNQLKEDLGLAVTSSPKDPPRRRTAAGPVGMDLDFRVKPNESIFFIETNCTSRTSLLYCSLESAARQNPQRDIYLVLQSKPDQAQTFPEYISAIPNIHMQLVNFTEFVKGSPVERIWEKVARSKYKLQTMSDIIRILLLFKHGGYYMDTDFISLRPLDSGRNFVVMQDITTINNAFMHFDQGHKYLETLLVDMPKLIPFVNIYTALGPQLMNLEAVRFCQGLRQGRCSQDLNIRGPRLFYPIHYLNWHDFYDPSKVSAVASAVNGSIAVHVYGFACRVYHLCVGQVKAGVPLLQLMKKSCPLTAEAMGNAINVS